MSAKWSLWKAALVGLGVQVLATVAGSDHGREVLVYLLCGQVEPMIVAITQLSVAPIIFVIVALIRNRFV